MGIRGAARPDGRRDLRAAHVGEAGVSLQPGDVILVRTGGLAATMIRFGAALRGAPNLNNHVAVAHHLDAHGTLWCVEGSPGGAGWRDARA